MSLTLTPSLYLTPPKKSMIYWKFSHCVSLHIIIGKSQFSIDNYIRLASAFMNTTSQRAIIRFERDPVGIATTLIPLMYKKNFEEKLESHLKGRKSK